MVFYKVTNEMARRESRSDDKNQVSDVVGEDTPTASALLRLRRQVYGAVAGPGAITKTAQEVDMRRTKLARIVAPDTIRKIARVERHLGS